MPNQIAKNKKRKSMTEHKAVLAALEMIARREKTTSMALMRKAVRESIRCRARIPAARNWLLPLVIRFSPKAPEKFASPAQVSRYKRSQRELDQLLLDLNLASPRSIQKRNSIVPPRKRISVFELEKGNASRKTI